MTTLEVYTIVKDIGLAINISADLEGYNTGIQVAESILQAFHTQAEAIFDAVEAEYETTKQKITIGIKTSLAMANVALQTIQSVIALMGVNLDPLTQMTLEIISTSGTVSLSLAEMWGTNPVTAALAAAIAAVTMTTGVTASVIAYQGRLKAQLMNQVAIMNMLKAGDNLNAILALMQGM